MSADERAVRLTDGTTVATRTLVWGAGVMANPLIGRLGLPERRGRLAVTPELAVPGVPGVWAAGDAAAVPDLAAPERSDGLADTPPTAQHAQRQGRVMGRNIAASLGVGRAKPYRHKDLGLVADLGGWDAVARPLGIPLTGPIAKVVTRGYHLYALPAAANRVRVAADWLFQTVLPRSPRSSPSSGPRTPASPPRRARSSGMHLRRTDSASGNADEPGQSRATPSAKSAAVMPSGWPVRPLHQFDPVAIGVGEPRRPEVLGAVGRGGGFDLHSSSGELGDGRLHGLDLDDQVVQTSRVDHSSARIVDELDGHEFVAGKLEHGEAAELGLRHIPEDLVTEPGVEGERSIQVRDPEADVQCPHRALHGPVQEWLMGRRPASDLREKSDVVAAGPVLDDRTVRDPPDVDEVPRRRRSRSQAVRRAAASSNRHVAHGS